jgi:hypothetical protein
MSEGLTLIKRTICIRCGKFVTVRFNIPVVVECVELVCGSCKEKENGD